MSNKVLYQNSSINEVTLLSQLEVFTRLRALSSKLTAAEVAMVEEKINYIFHELEALRGVNFDVREAAMNLFGRDIFWAYQWEEDEPTKPGHRRSTPPRGSNIER
jgi:hypothetical protein